MASSGNVGRASYKSERPHSSGSGSVSLRNNGGGAQGQQHSARPKAPMSSSRRSVTPISRTRSLPLEDDPESERVRVAVRLRPKNAEDLADSDYSDCVELQPELKRLKLRKNNWSSESYRFDDVFTESASQRRIYEVVAKPVVESVLDGCNGTVMAYGQTGTGKTYTLGRLGKEDESERGIMVRAMEDILAGTSTSDSVEVSYLQAMKVVNTVKVKEEFDYESLCRKLETQVDHLTVEIDRQQKLKENEKNEMKKLLEEFENSTAEAEKRFVARSELLEKENAKLTLHVKELLQELDSQKEQNKLLLDEITRLVTSVRNSKLLEEENTRLAMELNNVMKELKCQKDQNIIMHDEIERLEDNLKHSKEKISYMHENTTKTTGLCNPQSSHKSTRSRETILNQRNTITKICEEGKILHLWFFVPKFSANFNGSVDRCAKDTFKFGLQKILSLLQSEDLDVQIHAVKVVANLAAEEDNAKDFITSGGLNELIGISDESAREDIRNLAKKTLRSSPLFRAELLAE
ncbi:UNVERIFIED_CONTAM: Kinesin-like protein KIN-UC [Sesamum calycinum]|uniref:Kinesin-like protein KIN-UC n=1 Tax=Sesamum calycinum TaxID=2727403 RepID=A0AAW2LUU4_9LAMI